MNNRKIYQEELEHLHLPQKPTYTLPDWPLGSSEIECQEMEQALREKNPYAFFRYLRTFINCGPVYSVAFSPDGQTLVSGGADTTIKLWNLSTRQEMRTVRGHTKAVISLAISPDGKVLASGSADPTIKLWDLCTGHELHTLTEHASSVLSVAISPDGKTLASGSADTTIKLWDLGTSQAIYTLTDHAHSVLCVAISPDGKILASGSADTTIKLWNLKTGQEIRNIKAESGFVFAVSFHPSEQILASVHDGDRTIKLWDLNTGEEIRTITSYPEVVSIAISPDGQTLASGGGYPGVRAIGIWNLHTGKLLNSFQCRNNSVYHRRIVYSVAFSPDGQMLASGGQDTTVKLWGIPPALNIE